MTTLMAGRLDRRIELQCYVSDKSGDPTAGSWPMQAEIYAEQVERGRVRRLVSDQDLASAERIYSIRYRTDVEPGWRVQDGNDFWRVDGVSEGNGRRTETVLLCSRFDPNEREFE